MSHSAMSRPESPKMCGPLRPNKCSVLDRRARMPAMSRASWPRIAGAICVSNVVLVAATQAWPKPSPPALDPLVGDDADPEGMHVLPADAAGRYRLGTHVEGDGGEAGFDGGYFHGGVPWRSEAILPQPLLCSQIAGHDKPKRLGYILRHADRLRIGGLRVAVFPNDHRPVHVHVQGPGIEAIFILGCPDGPPVLRGSRGFTTAALNRIEMALADAIAALCGEREKMHGDY